MKIRLPRYMRPKTLADGMTSYYWEIPTWARKKGCQIVPEALGPDLGAAISRASQLNELLDAWRDNEPSGPTPGSVAWMVAQFEKHHKYLRLAPRTRRDYDQGLALICTHQLASGRCFGEVMVKSVLQKHVDALYERLQWVEDPNAPGGRRRRLTTANKAMRAARRMWGIGVRKGWADHNPFSKMDLEGTGGHTVPVARHQVKTFIQQADAMGFASMGTAAMLAFELCQREGDVIGTIAWSDYRPGSEILICQHKTGERLWLPLYDEEGELFPGLVERLDGTKRSGSLIVMRDQPDKRTKTYLPYKEDWFRHLFRRIADAAGLPKEVTFMGFRHGGMTELGDSGATDQELMAQSGHRTRQMLVVYTKPSQNQVRSAARKRRALRTKQGGLSE